MKRMYGWVAAFTVIACAAIVFTCTKNSGIGLSNPLDTPPSITKTKSDTTVSINDSVTLSVRAEAENGGVETYFWKSSLRSTTDSTSDSVLHVFYSAAGCDTVKAWVRDNEGVLSDTAEMYVTVREYKPYIRRSLPDTAVHSGDTVWVSIAASDTNSADSLLRYVWAVNSGDFRDTTTQGRFRVVCSKTDIYMVIVKVIDPSGQASDPDTGHILSKGQAPVILGPTQGLHLSECNTRVVFSPGWNSKYFRVLLDSANPPRVYLYNNMRDTSFSLELESEADYYLQIVGVDSLGTQYPSEIRSFSTPLCGDAYLRSVALSSGSLRKASNRNDSAFDKNAYDYEIHLNDTSKGVTVTPVLNDPAAALTINNSAWASGRESNEFSVGQTISIAVTSRDGKSLRTYRFLVRFKCSNDARLASLTVYALTGSIAYGPAFNPDTLMYRDTVSNEKDTLWFVPATVDVKASLWVKNEKITSGSRSSGVRIREGLDTIPMTLISECYTDTVKYRMISLRLLSSDAGLQNLTVTSGSLKPAFHGDTLNYIDTIENTLDTISITPTARNVLAKITVNGDTVVSGNRKKISNLQVGPNTATIVVFAPDGKTQKQYKTVIYRKYDVNTLLSVLEISAGLLAPSFTDTVFNYSDTVANSTDSIAIKARPKNRDCKLFLNGNALKPDTFSSKVVLSPARVCTLNVKVALPDGSKETVYRVRVLRRGSAESRLAQLTGAQSDSLSLEPAFKDTVYLYNDTVQNYRKSISIIAQPKDQYAVVTINGDTVNQQFTVDAISLASGGLTTIIVKVYAQDGLHNSTYTVRIVRVANFDAFLGSCTVSHGTLLPPFRFDTDLYRLDIEDSVAALYITPSARDTNASIQVSAPSILTATVKSGVRSPAIPLTAGVIDTVKISVTAENGITKKTYKIAVYKKTKNNAKLSGLKTSSPNLRPAFAAEDTMYFDTVFNRIDTTRISPFAMDYAGASIFVNGTAVAHGTWSNLIALASGNNTITVLAVAEDNTTTKRYFVNIYRDPRSDDATLSGLVTSGKLRPVFAKAATLYRDTVDAEDTLYTLTATTSSSLAAMRINNQLVVSGAQKAVRLTGTTDTIRVLVTAENPATSQEYRVIVSPGGSARLTSLTASAGTLLPAFDPAIVDYRDTVAFAVESLSVTPTTKDALAGTKVNGVTVLTGNPSPKFRLTVGSQTIPVIVTASSGGAQKEYRVAVVRLPLDSNILLSPATNTVLAGWNMQTFTWKSIPRCTFWFEYFNIADSSYVGGSQSYSSDTSFVLNNLPGNKSYLWGVVIKDWRDSTHVSPGWIFSTRNHLPTIPALSAPADTECFLVDSTINLRLSWAAATGQDAGETVQYLVCLGKTATPPVKTSGLTILQYTNQTLLDTGIYYWRIGASDGKDTTFSATRTVKVFDSTGLTNILVAPANNTDLTAWSTTLVWNKRNGFSYLPYYGADSTAIATAVGAVGTDTSRALSTLTGNKVYFWRVRLTKGGLTMYSPIWRFRTPNHAPAAPTIVSPSNVKWGDAPATITFTWAAATDADAGDTLKYRVYLGTSIASMAALASDTTALSYIVTSSAYAKSKYFWKVRISDGRDSAMSAIDSFEIGHNAMVYGDYVDDNVVLAEINNYTFQGTAGDIIIIKGFSGGNVYPEVKLYNGGIQRKSNYGSSNVTIIDTLPATGAYTITCGDHYATYSGNYGVKLMCTNDIVSKAPTIQYEDNFTTLYKQWHEITGYKWMGTAGDVVTVRITRASGSVYPEFQIIGPDGTVLGTYFNGSTTMVQGFTVPSTGAYSILFYDHYFGYSGAYNVQLTKTN